MYFFTCDLYRVLPTSATNENAPNGTIQSFTVGRQGAITLVDTISTGGSIPAYCAGLSTGQIAVPNVWDLLTLCGPPLTAIQYSSGSVSLIPTEGDYLHFCNASDVLTFPAPTTGTRGASEPHMVYQYGSEVFVPDKVSWDLSLGVLMISQPSQGQR